MIVIAVPFYVLLVWLSGEVSFSLLWFLVAIAADCLNNNYIKTELRNAYYRGKIDDKQPASRSTWGDDE